MSSVVEVYGWVSDRRPEIGAKDAPSANALMATANIHHAIKGTNITAIRNFVRTFEAGNGFPLFHLLNSKNDCVLDLSL